MADENGQWLLSRRSEADGSALAVALHYGDLVRQLLWHRNSRVMNFVLKQERIPRFCIACCFYWITWAFTDWHCLAQTIWRRHPLGYKTPFGWPEIQNILSVLDNHLRNRWTTWSKSQLEQGAEAGLSFERWRGKLIYHFTLAACIKIRNSLGIAQCLPMLCRTFTSAEYPLPLLTVLRKGGLRTSLLYSLRI